MTTTDLLAGRQLPDLNQLPLDALYHHLAADGHIGRLLRLARDEDLGIGGTPGDITTIACGLSGKPVELTLAARTPTTVAGLVLLRDLLDAFAPSTTAELRAADGDVLTEPAPLATLRGPADEVLRLERPMLNLLSRLCGIASLTAKYRAELEHGAPGAPSAHLYDTRKTTPGLRYLEKYAVRCGGGMLHRIGLHDAVLIKDNHLSGVSDAELAQTVHTASRRAREMFAVRFIEVEVDRIEQFAALLTLPERAIDIVLLDNMDESTLKQAVSMRDNSGLPIALESSGGITLDTIAAKARTGVERLSCGALTHQAVSVDLGLDA